MWVARLAGTAVARQPSRARPVLTRDAARVARANAATSAPKVRARAKPSPTPLGATKAKKAAEKESPNRPVRRAGLGPHEWKADHARAVVRNEPSGQAARRTPQPGGQQPDMGQRAKAKPAVYSSGTVAPGSAASRRASRPIDPAGEDKRQRLLEQFPYPVEPAGAPAASSALEPRVQTRPRALPCLDLSGSGAGVATGMASPPPDGGVAAASSSAAAAPAPALASTDPAQVTAELGAQQVAAYMQSSPQMQRLQQPWLEQSQHVVAQQVEMERMYRFGIGNGKGKGRGARKRGVRRQRFHSPLPLPRARDEGATRRRLWLKNGVFCAVRLSWAKNCLGGAAGPRPPPTAPPAGGSHRSSSRHAGDAHVLMCMSPKAARSGPTSRPGTTLRVGSVGFAPSLPFRCSSSVLPTPSPGAWGPARRTRGVWARPVHEGSVQRLGGHLFRRLGAGVGRVLAPLGVGRQDLARLRAGPRLRTLALLRAAADAALCGLLVRRTAARIGPG